MLEKIILYCKVCGKAIPIRNKRRTTYCSNECHQASCKGQGNPMYGKIEAMKGKEGSFFGKKHKAESREKMKNSHRNHPSPHSLEQIDAIRKIGLSNKIRWQDPAYRQNIINKTLLKGKNFDTAPEMEIQNLLNSLNIKYIKQKIEKKFVYDLYLPDSKIYIEVNGDFWHANPKKYKADSELNLPGRGKTKAIDIWKKDNNKKEYVENLGFKLITLWESDIKEGSKKIIERLVDAGLPI